MTNAASSFWRDGRFYPSRRQIIAATDDFDALAARGLGLSEIADTMGVTRGTACVLRRWSRERAAGLEPRFETPPSVRWG